ncbi:hypothetical protein OF830_26565 [Bacillus paramycoides]|uniref:hypothetical protein n=1 Tax=Bacillus cereus group TaxID=86661 RepID=UPI000BFA1237|nr:MULTISPECIES: hypothetical protein [Bacillus cereus group]MCW9134351.1 hypothetical protein [Bacillus paramycoides]PER21252.1 hypothetical protein CN490_28125 [Bacillus cereus]TKI41570.1 hypothetical protein FC700_19090 [Bacillus mycoides]
MKFLFKNKEKKLKRTTAEQTVNFVELSEDEMKHIEGASNDYYDHFYETYIIRQQTNPLQQRII